MIDIITTFTDAALPIIENALYYSNFSGDLGVFNIIMTSVFATTGPAACYNELNGANTGYSKFASPTKQLKVSSRVGMLIIYVPAFITSVVLMKFLQDQNKPIVVASLVAAHFGKRILEVLFLHKYSGNIDLDGAVPGGIMYMGYAFCCIYYAGTVPDAVSKSAISPIGMLLYLIGEFGNFYHHYLLASLRPNEKSSSESSSSVKKYVIPTGGLFEYVTCPHYFFEIIAWIGVGIIAKHVNSWFVAFSMCGYLLGRSKVTTEWYQKKMSDYPKTRKHMIPFVF